MIKEKRRGLFYSGVLLSGFFIVNTLVGCGGTKAMSANFTQVTAENFDENKYYMNTKNTLAVADPFVIDGEDGFYYAYGTSDKLNGYGFLVWRSKDLANWEEVGTAYYMSKDTWGVRDFWAPEVTKYNDKYYLHYTAKDKEGKIKIGMSVADTPVGPFNDIKDEPFFYPGYNVIDSNIIIDDDGRMYMYYSRDCSEHIYNGKHESHIYAVEINGMEEVVGEPVEIIKPELWWESLSGDWRWNEGPEVIKKGGKYYLMYSTNFYDSRDYSVAYAISDSPLGPFEKSEDNRLLYVENNWTHVSGPGHNYYVESPDGTELFTSYHSHINTSGGGVRQINVDKMGFREDGTMYINGPSVTPQPLPSGVSEYKSLNSLIDNITINGKTKQDTKLLYDGEVVYHEDKEKYEWKGEGKIELTINFKEEVNLSDILIYGNVNEDKKPIINKVKLKNGHDLKGIDSNLPKLPGEAIILSFEEIMTSSVTIHVDNKGIFGISELVFLGK